MHDTRGVRRHQRGGDLDSDIEDLAQHDMATSEGLSQRLTLDVLHRDELLAVSRFTECIDGADVWMIEGGGGARLLLEAGHAGRILRQFSG
jgi:hypothetical protein